MVSAHEIGHEILLSFGGHNYSKAHKGSTHWSLIIQEVNEDEPVVPDEGEIGLPTKYKQAKKTKDQVKVIGVYNTENCTPDIKEKLIRKIYYQKSM